MKKILLTAVALLTMSAGAMAQNSTGKINLVCPDGQTRKLDVYATKPVPYTGNSDDMIFESSSKCILEWTGENWHALWCNVYPKDVVVFPPAPKPANCPECEEGEIKVDNGTICTPPPLRFMAYNLGADPEYDTPKKQIKYLVDKHPYGGEGKYAGSYERDLDATVSGGLYQWGRSDLDHGGTRETGKGYIPAYSRYRGIGADDNNYNDNRSGGVSNEKTNNPTNGVFYYGSLNWYNGPDPDNLWGNGNNGQKTIKTKHDPCPDGFRVPTQDEWEQLVAYDCETGNAYSGSFKFPRTEFSWNTNRGLTWVRVLCNADPEGLGKASKTGLSGYAIYATSEWNDTKYDNGYRDGTKPLYEDDAPEPLIFLPAAGQRWFNNGYGLKDYNDVHSLYTWGGGYYWSSTAEGEGAKTSYLSFETPTGSYEEVSTYKSGDQRANGRSIRCVME